jgi:CRISPR-associated protein Cmr5
MATRDQERAALAYDHVSAYLLKDEAKKYATIVHKMPSLLQSAGLCQAMHFASSRKDKDQQRIVDHLARQLHRVNPAIIDDKTLLERCRKASLAEYLQLTDEAMACAAWYRRLVQGVLKIEASEADDEDSEGDS